MSGKNKTLKKLQLQMLRIQQGIYHKKERLIIAMEGVDASGKGGVIRRITENLDPRSFHVYPIGVPSPEEQGKHYLYRFWTKLPSRGMISLFDRTWYGRVLAERVEELIPEASWRRAYQEINEFERQLTDDGIILIKILLKISKQEQLKRFEARLNDPYKQWKITEADINNRAKWSLYTAAQKEMIKETTTPSCPWNVIETDNKEEARQKVLEVITQRCAPIERWMEEKSHILNTEEIKKALEKLG